MSKKKWAALGAVSYVTLNVVVAYKAGVIERIMEDAKYNQANPDKPHRTSSELFAYAFKWDDAK